MRAPTTPRVVLLLSISIKCIWYIISALSYLGFNYIIFVRNLSSSMFSFANCKYFTSILDNE